MCRLALLNNEGIMYIEENYGLERFFDHLEAQLGGHGNGVGFIYNDGSYFVRKGVNLTNEDIAEEVLRKIKHIKWIIYHTRLASVGSISNKNCHPFVDNGRIMAMNGTEYNYAIVNDNLTDTENILLATENITKGTRKYHSVFLGYENGKVFANRNYGSLEYLPCGNNGMVFASSFLAECYEWDSIYVAPRYFIEGDDMEDLDTAKQNKYYNCGVYGRYYAW